MPLIIQLNSLITLIPITQTPQVPNPHFKTHLISLKWAKRRSGSNRTRRNTHKLILNSISAAASTLKILPEPWDTLAKEFLLVSSGDGNGGNFWFKNGFGNGGDNWGRRRKGLKLGFLVRVTLVFSASLAMWAVLGREKVSEGDLVIWIAVVVGCLMGRCLWRREIRDWVLGFCCGAALMGFGFRRNHGDLIKWVDGFRANILPSFGVVCKKKKRFGTFGGWI